MVCNLAAQAGVRYSIEKPNMATFLFTDATFNDKLIKVFNKEKLSLDFTYIDDIVADDQKTILENQA